MKANNKLTTEQLRNHQLVLKKASVQDSLFILENAHYSIVVIIAKMKRDGFDNHQQTLLILEEELNLIKEEINRLNVVINSI